MCFSCSRFLRTGLSMLLFVCAASLAYGQSEWRVILHEDSVEFAGVAFADSLKGWLTYFPLTETGLKARMLTTSDGGLSWDTIRPNVNPIFTALHFVDGNNGWTWRGTGLLRTTDGGTFWEELDTTLPVHSTRGIRFTPYALHFRNADTGWIAGTYSGLFRTFDGGKTWHGDSLTATGGWRTFYDIEFVDEAYGWAIGGIQALLLARTTDGGATWIGNHKESNLPYNNIVAFSFADRRFGFAIPDYEGSGYFLRTDDGGVTWRTDSTLSPLVEGSLTDVLFIDSLNGWVLESIRTRDSSESDHCRIHATTDGARTWRTVHYDTLVFPTKLMFPSKDIGYASGKGGILKLERGSSGVTADHAAAPVFSLIPNPTSSRCEVVGSKGSQIVSLVILDERGREVYTRVVEKAEQGSRLRCDLSSLAAGYYLCRIESTEGSETHGVVVIR